MRRWLLRAVLAIAVFGGAAFYWLFWDNRLPARSDYRLDLAALDAAAASLPGPGPVAIDVERIVHERVPRIAMEAGASLADVDLIRASYRLRWADGRSAIIDTGYRPEDEPPNSRAWGFDPAAFARVQAALTSAAIITVTHEHNDHIGGLIASPALPAVMRHAVLNPEQLADQSPGYRNWPAGVRESYRPLAYTGLRAIAPGMVLVRAAGHTPGSQLVFVRRADGQRYLFMGDTASLLSNVERQRIRSRLVTDFYTHDDRHAVMSQVMALHALMRAHPDIVLVPGHDAAVIDALVRQGRLEAGFRPAQG